MRERRDDELRPLSFRRGFTKYAEGSVLVSAGDTRVLCTATVTPGVPRFLTGKGEGWVTAEYGLLPRSTGTRCDREAVKGKQSGPHAGNPASDRTKPSRCGRPKEAR